MKKQYLKSSLCAFEFFYNLEKDGVKGFYSREEIIIAVKKCEVFGK